MKVLLYLEIAGLMAELVSVEVDNKGSTVPGDSWANSVELISVEVDNEGSTVPGDS